MYNEVVAVINDILYLSNSNIHGNEPRYNDTSLLYSGHILPFLWPLVMSRFHGNYYNINF